MKKILLISILSVFSITVNASPDIFNKIGKAIDKADKAISKVTGTTQNKTSAKQSSSNVANNKKPAPNVDIKISEASRYSDGVLIPYTIKNDGEEQYNVFVFYLSDVGRGSGDRSTIIFDNDKEYYISQEYNRTDYQLPSDTKRSGFLYVTKFPKGAKSIKQIRLSGRAEGGPQERYVNNYFGEWLYTFDNVPLKDFQESNQEGIYCTHPDLKVFFNGVERNTANKTLILDYTLTNTGDDDLEFYLGGDVEAFDENGNQFYGISQTAGGGTTLKLDSEQTIRVLTTINNIPSKAKKFSSVTAPFGKMNTPLLSVKFMNLEF